LFTEPFWKYDMKKSLLIYLVVLIVSGACIYLVLLSGSRLESGRPASQQHEQHSNTAVSPSQQKEDGINGVSAVFHEHLREPLSILLLQVIVVLVVSRLVSGLFHKIGQPSVIGEMVAGIILGPSLLGMLFPNAMSFLFPASSMGPLRLLSQIGVILFMFIVGTEINARRLKEKARAAVSIVVPFIMGVTVSLLIYRTFAPSDISFTSFALFMGVAMSITAFPVLARIIEERGMSNSYLGSTAIACAAVDDVTAWCILATVIALAKMNGIGPSALTIFLALAFTAFMLYVLRPQLNRMIGEGVEIGKNGNSILVCALVLAFISAYFTEVIGIHALFGAFLAGAVMPSTTTVRSFLRDKLAAFSSAALLPLFFAFTGLRTQISLLNDWQSWLVCVGIIAVAIAGKLGGGMLAARWAGMSWSDSISIGVLMNTRGLVELVVLNIGYDLGILSGRIFAIMVLMALVTTCMTGPLLSLIEFATRKEIVKERSATIA
jgi:Kef-type K+ transport system membrane component KefB